MATTPEKRATGNNTAAQLLERIGQKLGLSLEELAGVLGSEVSKLERGVVIPGCKEEAITVLMIRLYRTLHHLTDGVEAEIQAWMRNFNHQVGGVPAEMIQSVLGLTQVVQHLHERVNPATAASTLGAAGD